MSGKPWTMRVTRRASAVTIGSIALFVIAVAPALAGSVATDPEPDLSCPDAYGSGVLTHYVTAVDMPPAGDWLVTVEFTIDGGSCELTLATYELPGPSFTLPQELYDSMTGTFGPGTHSLTATLPREADQAGCFSQYDFAFGPAIETLTGSDKYGDRLIRARIVGSETCSQATATPSPTPEQTLEGGTPTPSPTPEDDFQGGTPTPAPSQPDTAIGPQGGPNPIPTVGFGLLLLGSLAALVVANVKAASSRT